MDENTQKLLDDSVLLVEDGVDTRYEIAVVNMKGDKNGDVLKIG